MQASAILILAGGSDGGRPDRHRQDRRLRAAAAGAVAATPDERWPRPIRALVLVPTRELAVQVAESVTRYARADLTSTLVYGG